MGFWLQALALEGHYFIGSGRLLSGSVDNLSPIRASPLLLFVWQVLGFSDSLQPRACHENTEPDNAICKTPVLSFS